MKYFILQVGLLLAGGTVLGQSATDSIILKFLSTNGDFNRLSQEDMSHLKHNMHQWRFAKTGNVVITQFGNNIDHSVDYLLFEGKDWYTVVGNNELGNCILQLNELLKKRKISMKNKLRLRCYDLFIQNESRLAAGIYLMEDPDTIQPTK